MIELHAAPELAAYQDEPKQMPSGVVGKNAYLRLGFQRRGDRFDVAFQPRVGNRVIGAGRVIDLAAACPRAIGAITKIQTLVGPVKHRPTRAAAS